MKPNIDDLDKAMCGDESAIRRVLKVDPDVFTPYRKHAKGLIAKHFKGSNKAGQKKFKTRKGKR